MSPETVSHPPSTRSLVNTFRALAGVVTLLVLVQAFLGARIIFDGDTDALHRFLGLLTFAIGVAALVFALVAQIPRTLVIVSAAIAVLLVVQVGLGFSIEDSPSAGTWHIPLGMLIFGACVYQQSLLRRLRTVD